MTKKSWTSYTMFDINYDENVNNDLQDEKSRRFSFLDTFFFSADFTVSVPHFPIFFLPILFQSCYNKIVSKKYKK